MSPSQGSVSNCAADEFTSCERSDDFNEAEKGENAASLQTAEYCATQLSSILSTLPAPQGEEPGQNPSTSTRFATPNKLNPTNDVQIGSGWDKFEISITIEKHHNLSHLLLPMNTNASSSETALKRNVWFSYRCFGTVVQSEIFTISTTALHVKTLAPMMNAFRVRGSLPELAEYFNKRKNATLRVHLCAEGEVLGTSSVDLRQFVAKEGSGGGTTYSSSDSGDIAFESRTVQSECVVEPRGVTNKEDNERGNCPRILVKLYINRDPAISRKLGNRCRPSPDAAYLSVSSQTMNPTCANKASSPIRKHGTTDDNPEYVDDSHPLNVLQKKEEELNGRETELSKKEKGIYEAVASLKTKRCEWEQWRHQQELEWHDKLRNKESAMMRVIEERVCTIEKERLSSTEASKNEYEKLQARLRKALIEVEAKERQLKDTELGYQNECNRKLAEIELRERLMKEELRVKVNAAVEQAVLAEKSAAAAGKKVKQIETEMDQHRERHRKTPEVTLMHQMAELKGQLVDSERRIESIKAEKVQVTAEKEVFRSNVHKLARALRREREKAMATRGSNNQQVHLSYDENQQTFVLGGGQGGIQKILTDLSNLSQLKGLGCQSPLTHNNAPPMPSPPPSRPTSSSVQSKQSGTCFG